MEHMTTPLMLPEHTDDRNALADVIVRAITPMRDEVDATEAGSSYAVTVAVDLVAVLRHDTSRFTSDILPGGPGDAMLARMFALTGYDAYSALAPAAIAAHAQLLHERFADSARDTDPLYVGFRQDEEAPLSAPFGGAVALLGMPASVPDKTLGEVYGTFQRVQEYARVPIGRHIQIAEDLNDSATSSGASLVNCVMAGLARDTGGVTRDALDSPEAVEASRLTRASEGREIHNARQRLAAAIESKLDSDDGFGLHIVAREAVRALREYATDTLTLTHEHLPALGRLAAALVTFAQNVHAKDPDVAHTADSLSERLRVASNYIESGHAAPGALSLPIPDAPTETMLDGMFDAAPDAAFSGARWFHVGQTLVADVLAAIAKRSPDYDQHDAYMFAARTSEHRAYLVSHLLAHMRS